MHDFPNDFQIFELGEYDDATGAIMGEQNPTFICTVADLLAAVPTGEPNDDADYR